MAEKSRILGQQIIQGKTRTKTEQISFTHIDESYSGSFTFHHPSLIERMNIGVLKSQFLQGLEGRVDVLTDNIAHMSATLDVVLDDAPEWFKIGALYEYEVLEGVYDKYTEWLNSFRKPSGRNTDKGDNTES